MTESENRKNGQAGKKRLSRRTLLLGTGAVALAGAAGSAAVRHLTATSPVSVENLMTKGSGAKRKVLVVTGSAREGGNTDVLAQSFMDGAKEAGHDVQLFAAGKTPVGGCLHCDACWSSGNPCVVEDNYSHLWPKLEWADLLVLCSPLYWYNMSGHIRCAIDRMYPYSKKDRHRDLKIREAMLLMCGQSMLLRSFAGAYESYRQMLGYLRWTDRGRLFATGVDEMGDMGKSSALAIAREMGRTL